MICDESVKFQELSLELHTTNLEMKPSLSFSLIESSSLSEEGHGGQQMSPELLNKEFQRNPHNSDLETTTKSLMAPYFQGIKQVCSS